MPSKRAAFIMKSLSLWVAVLLAPLWSDARNLPLTLPVGGMKSGEVLEWTNIMILREPDGPRGVFKHGFRTLNDSAAEWQKYYGVQFEIKLPDARETEITAGIFKYQKETNAFNPPVSASVHVSGPGWHTVTLPWSAFDSEQENTAFLKTVKEFRLAAKRAGGSPVKFELRHPRVIKAPVISLEAEVLGQAVPQNGVAEYAVTVGNGTAQRQSVSLSFVRRGWQSMDATVVPAALELAPGETKTGTVRVTVPDRVPPGGHEEQILQAIGNGDAANATQLKFITTRAMPHPYILHTPARWQEIRDKVAKYDWARAQQDEIVQRANNWKVPAVADPAKAPDDTYGPYVFSTQNEGEILACGYAWQLTHDTNAAEKVARFLRRLSDPTNGYPATLRACNQSLVQEGGFFQHVAMADDMIGDAGVLSAADRAQIEKTFRLFQETIARVSDYGPINNWNLAEDCGAFYCALAVQDLAAAQRWFAGPAGICDELGKGVMDDGWWYECSISYNLWCASEFTQAALAYEPFGVDFLHLKVPAAYSPRVFLVAALSGGNVLNDDSNQILRPFGMNPEIFGPNTKPYRSIEMMWDSLLPFIDYRGVMFGVNDSTENRVTGSRGEIGGSSPFELAYYAYRKPAYAALIKLNNKRDLLYAVPDLPANTPENFRASACADNVGLAMLRSQATNRPAREQIQAALHYGTHGWAHGHYDRTDLISLFRYGRNFWNPESVFWVYEPFMYKFYCQCSVNHTMVVADEKMQESTPGERLLFRTGDAMQATVVETDARWSNPPYGGMVYDYVPVKTFAEKGWREGRSVPVPANAPRYGSLTGFTEKILQRRALLVLEDYVVLADFVKGTNAHTFESLYHLKGFQGLDAPAKKFLRHDAQWNSDPVGSAQFVTDCDWYSANAPAVARFIERWGPGADNEGSRSTGNEDGVLKLDVHSLWPPQQEIMIGAAPEMREVQKRLWWTVRGDGKTLADGKLGAWILGQADADVSVDGVKQLELETKTELAKLPTLFWAKARIVTKDGREIPLNDLPVKFENVQQPEKTGEDYFGGPIKIVGEEYQSATPAEPKNENQPAFVRVDLSGVNAARFKATIGGDYPLGDESQRRKVTAIRAPQADQARFLTVIEPYEDQPVVKSAVALSADKLRVELADGRVQEITLNHFDGSGQDVSFDLVESRDGKILRQETTAK
jgi:hypothetical protein